MDSQNIYTLAVDLGGTNIRVCAFKNDNPTFIELIKERSKIDGDPHELLSTIDRLIKQVMERLGITFMQVDHIGISIPDAVSPEDGILYFPSTLLKWQGINVRKFFTDIYQVPVYVENDANMAALGEFHFGAGKGARNLIYLTLSTGVGAGIIVDGRLYRGSNGFAGEVGQMVLNTNGKRCPNCGKPGCVEVLASGTAVKYIANDSSDQSFHGKTAEDIVPLAREGNPEAIKIMEQVSNNIAVLVLNLIFSFDADTIVIGGGLSAAFDLIYPYIDSYLAKNLPETFRKKFKIVKNELEGDVGLLGSLGIKNKSRDHKLKTVIFDHDGVMVFSEEAHRLSFTNVIKKHFNKDLTVGQYNYFFQGKTDYEGYKEYLEYIGEASENINSLINESSEEYINTYAERVIPNMEVINLIRRLHELKIPVGIATSSNRKEVETSLRAFNIEDCVDTTITANDITHGKPSPEIYIITATRMNVLPDECLVIEDTPVGIAAAKEAGAKCIAVTTTHSSPQLSQADYIRGEIKEDDILSIMQKK